MMAIFGFATSSDIFKINIETNQTWRFSASDGLPQNEIFSAFLS